MTTQSTQTAPTAATGGGGAVGVAEAPRHGAEIVVPLNRLKASPRNARRTPHSPSAIEAFAASIKTKGVLQPPVVEIERSEDGTPTGAYLVTIGEGRRRGLRLLAKRKAIKTTHPVRVIVDDENDAHEISLDENITREAMHPADQFEAFQRLAVEKGYGCEEIAARFGVTAHVVRQRLRLAAVAPELMQAYRGGDLTLDQLMGFAVSEDHERQRQVFAQIGQTATGFAIRRAMTEAKVQPHDRRVRFVGVEAYEAAGGAVLRDLFTEDGGGWLEDVGLLDRLVGEKLEALAEEVRVREGFKWAEAHLDFPYALALGRVYPAATERGAADAAEIASLSAEYDRLVIEMEDAEEPSAERDARLEEIDAALQAFGPDFAFRPDDLGRAGVIVTLGYDGLAKFERGLVRAEDAAPEPDTPESGDSEGGPAQTRTGARGEEGTPAEAVEIDEGLAPLSDRLILDLTAHRTAGLRDALARNPTLALTTVVHALALQVFYRGHDLSTPMQLRIGVFGLERFAPGVNEGPAGQRINARSLAWAERLPTKASALWPVLLALPGGELLDLFAHCASLGLNAVRDAHDRRPAAWAQAEALASEAGLDMTTTWSATAVSYFGRVSKARILEAVTETVGAPEADRIAGFKKPDMAEAAERLLAGRGWLPPVLRTVGLAVGTVSKAVSDDPGVAPGPDGAAPTELAEAEPVEPEDGADAYPFAAE